VPADARIRPATDRDLRPCLELFGLLYELQSPMWVFEIEADLLEHVTVRYRRLTAEPDARHLVADADGRVVGMAIGEVVRASRISGQRALEVSNVVVLPSHRGRGIARRLVAGLTAFAEERGVPWLMLRTFAANEPALRFWRGMGFAPRVVQMVAAAADIAR
jgi:GNAT superfamily N-acetyltransferase